MTLLAQTLLQYFAPKKIRTFLEFAEQEIVMPDGVRRGLKYSADFMPWDRELFKMFDSSEFNRFWLTGSVQSGKSFRCLVIPVLYHIFEVEEDFILCAPDAVMASEFYNSKIKPIIALSKYKKYLPKEGKGSKGGAVPSLLFRNGARLRFMGAGGGDTQRSSYTSRAVGVTEANKVDKSGKASKETDPLGQFESRSDSYGDNARFYGECTTDNSYGRVHQEVVEWGSNSKCYFKCPHCEEYIPFEREFFTGWDDKDNEIDARDSAGYICPNCAVIWSESDRQIALKSPKMVHEEGKKTMTFGFSSNAMSSGLLTMANIAQSEFKAKRADTNDAKKKLYQFTWAIPFDEDTTEMSNISREAILRKINKWMRGSCPDDTEKVTVGIDIGQYQCWYSVWAWQGLAEGYCVDYGCINVPHDRGYRVELAVLSALNSFKKDYLDHGWKCGDDIKTLDLCLVDSGWKPDIAYEFTKAAGSKYLPVKGFGTSKHQMTWRAPKETKTRTVGHEWAISKLENGIALVELNSDHWKTEVHNGFMADMGHAGNLSLFNAKERDHFEIVRHILAEIMKSEFIPGKGIRNFLDCLSRINHHLDDCAYARAGADMLGMVLVAKEVVAQAVQQRRESVKPNRPIRSKY